MEYGEDDQSWYTPAKKWSDPIEDFAAAFADVTDGLIAATPADLDRAIAAARDVAVAKYNQGDQDDGQS